MNEFQTSVFEEDLLGWVPLNFFLFFTPRFIRSRITRRFLTQLTLMVKNRIPFLEGLRTIASPLHVRMPIHYAITRTFQFIIFVLIVLFLIFFFGGLVPVITLPILLILMLVLRPGFVLQFMLSLVAIYIIVVLLYSSIVAALIFLFFVLFFLQMNLQSVKINDSYLVRRVARELAMKLTKGASLAAAMKSLPRLFLPFHITMMMTAEATGKMEEVIHQLAEYERWRGRFYVVGLKNFAYPMILLFISVTIITFISVKIVPKFEEVFAQLGLSLPALTTSVVSVLKSTMAGGGLGLLLLVVMVIIIFNSWGSLKYYVPVIRHVARPLSASRFLMALGYQLKARLPINDAVRVARHVDTGLVFSHYMHDLQTRIEKGVSLGTALEQVAIFPPLAKHWVSMAEFAEALDTELIDISKKLAEDGEIGFTKLTTILEPIVHLIIALLIAIIVISFYLPIFNIPRTAM